MTLVKNSEVGQKHWSAQARFLLGFLTGPHIFCCIPLALVLKKIWYDLFPGIRRESGCGWKLIRHSPGPQVFRGHL